MRPIELTAEGFGPFRDRVVVDFTDADFFALVGPTGAGKSSVIDAMCFALYGFVPRYGDHRLVAPALTTGVQQARVQFVFEASATRYTATRVVRRTSKGGASTKECRLERWTDGGTDVIAGDARDADRVVQEILGLTPEHFTCCVVLPQGEFARFLHDKPSERQALLVELLGLEIYGQMATAARTRAAADKARAMALVAHVASLADATEEAEQRAAERTDALAALVADVTEAEPRVTAGRQEIADARQAVQTSSSLLEKLSVVAVPADVAARSEQITGASADAADHNRTAERLEAAATDAEAQADQAPDPAAMQEHLTRRRTLDALEASVPKLQETAAQHRATLEAATRLLDDLDTAIEAGRRDVQQAENAHRAHVLLDTLAIGQPCPVCRAPVTTVPRDTLPPDLGATRDRLQSLLAKRTQQDQECRDLATQVAASDQKLKDVRGEQERLLAEASDARDVYALETELARIQDLRRNASETRLTASKARARAAQSARLLDELNQQQGLARNAYVQQRDAVAGLAPPAPTADLASDWSLLAAWAAETSTAVQATVERERSRLEDAVATLRDELDTLRHRCRDVGISCTNDDPYESILTTAASEHAKAEAHLAAVRRDRKHRDELQTEVTQLDAQVQVANELARLLSAKGFEAWVLAEALDELVAGASVTLTELSQGAYSLGVNEQNDFVVIDHREADAIRPAKTLSGGETFQASLALALALADHLGQYSITGGAKLESLFLDEGFGTLDEDSLEVVAATLETLAGGSRVVGLVTHVKELAARVPVRYEVRKVGRTALVERSAE